MIMTTTIMNPSKALSILSSMYLCRPTKENIETWKQLLEKDDSGFMYDLWIALKEIDVNSERELDKLLWEYTRLFIGPYRLPCPPWESVYTSPKRLMMQEAADEVIKIYHETGLAISSADVMPDHIGAELNFLAVLFQKMNDDSEGNGGSLRIIERFLNEHLKQWVPRFVSDMERSADSALYKALARVTGEIIIIIGG